MGGSLSLLLKKLPFGKYFIFVEQGKTGRMLFGSLSAYSFSFCNYLQMALPQAHSCVTIALSMALFRRLEWIVVMG